MIRKLEIKSGPLQVEVVDGAVASPFAYDRHTGEISGCLYDASRNRIDLSLRTSGVGGDRVTNNNSKFLIENATTLRHVTGNSVYLGHLMGHYGHFITETLSTFWSLSCLNVQNFVFHPFIFRSFMPFMRDFFDVFSITPEQVILLREPCSFQRIIVPERTFHLNACVHERHKDIADRILNFHVGQNQIRTRKVFLSRSLLENDNRGIDNTLSVDNLMASLGFEIIHPQKLTTKDQLRIYSTTSIMVGFSGSALHNCIFLNDRCAVIEIGDARSPAKPLPAQVLCNLSAKIEALHLPYQVLTNTEAGAQPSLNLKYLENSIKSALDHLKKIGIA